MKIRLNKVQGELNLGLSTIVEFLQKKGFEIKEDPNAVVPEEGYKLLMEEFSADKKARIQSDNFTKERQSKDKPKTTPAEAPKTEEPKAEVTPAPEVVKKEEEAKPVEQPKKEEPKLENKIVITGRIDLDALKKPAKKEENKDKVLFIDARNYYTVVDRTLNEWSEWQMKNLNAIVWLYRGEKGKYKKLIEEYRAELGYMLTFEERAEQLTYDIANFKLEAKFKVENAERKYKKQIQQQYDEDIAILERKLIIAKEAIWLTEKFGEGEYKDVLGLCKLADRAEIAEKGYSLTPGAYVGVAPVEDEGVDFVARMAEIHNELITLQAESNELMDTISKNIKELGL